MRFLHLCFVSKQGPVPELVGLFAARAVFSTAFCTAAGFSDGLFHYSEAV
ncbi:hypothetical protein HMPREF9123_0862 [Neisseria bacilliformis ATCC BAA-1200]|uniref:Uncharacterized protein n=1 Tax=Neisseria bacilliformis ATCC BAA-1200 TaxID=888742 RepID=F2BAV8_9NEIS|nr:hypothetical protein HMPREF9123_0862 [Neisseria bacilliformis ATCC BAA-1200]